MSSEFRPWYGLILIAISLVATMWLAATGQLVLYIHPRYIVFTVIMGAIGLVFVVATVANQLRRSVDDRGGDDHAHDGHLHDDDPDHDGVKRSRLRKGVSIIGAVVTLVIATAFIALPPATLTAATAAQRDINSATLTADAQTVDDAASASDGAFAAFDVRDWSSLLRQTTDIAFYAGKPASVIGFITEDPDDPANMFYVSRFVVTCCAVDAQPLGVPVYLENWKSSLAVDQWVQVDGEFTGNPSRDSTQPISMVPTDVIPVDQPAEPYLF